MNPSRGARSRRRGLRHAFLVQFPKPAPSVPARPPVPPQLQQIMRPADELPLARSSVQAPQVESLAAAHVFDLPEHRLHGLRPLLVGRSAALRHELSLHTRSA